MTKTNLQETVDAAAAVSATATEEAKRAAEERIAFLIARDVVLSAREKAVKAVKAPGREELLLLLKQHGYTHRRTAEGKASISESAGYKVTDIDKLVDLFVPADDVAPAYAKFWAKTRESLCVLFEQIKLDKAFWLAAKKAHIKIETAAVPDFGARFKVEAHKTKDAKAIQDGIIDQTKEELQQRVDVLARRMIERNARSET